MLNFIYYPVSAILWFWHKVFGFVLGPSSGVAWALSVIFLVFTLRAVLFKPAANQLKTQRQMQEFQPQIKALQKKYSNDRQRLAVEMQKLQKENGFNPLASCLPILLQAPVFIGLFHVLRSFNRTTGGFGRSAMSVQDNANTANYVFNVSDVQSFLDAKLFGAPLAAQISSTPDQLLVYVTKVGETVTRLDIALVAVPLMIIAGIATHFTARASVARQAANPTAAAATPQTAIMNKLVLWVFPLFVVVGGPFFPVAILLYWLSNNGWTLVQQHYLFANMAKQEEAKRVDSVERRAATAPKPGAKPVSTRKKVKPADVALPVDLAKGTDTDSAEEEVAELAAGDTAPAPRTAPTAPARRAGAGPTRPANQGSRTRTSSGRAPRKKR